MRERPNSAFNTVPATSDSRPNDLYRSLRSTFDHLLQSADPDRYSLLADSYVNNLNMEEALAMFCSGTTHASAFLVGATGIGKSTLIRHALQINRAPVIVSETLFVPFSLNQRHIPNEQEMRRQLATVFQEAVWLAKRPNGGESHFTQDDILDLAIFLKASSPDLLNDPRLDLMQSEPERTLALSKHPEFAYQFSQAALKYFSAKNVDVKRIVLIIDDLEMKSGELQQAAVINALESSACLMNGLASRQLPVRLLIALRPETHSWVSRLEQVQTTEFRVIVYTEPVSLFDIFKARFDSVYQRKDYEHLRDPVRHKEAIGVLEAIGEALASRFNSRFVRLNNHNVRASLETFRLIVCNRRWLQRDSEWRNSFTIEEHNFGVSPAAVLRALGIGEGEVYPQRRTCLANILYNTREPVSDLLLLYILKYLFHRSDDTAEQGTLVHVFKQLLKDFFDQHMFLELLEYGVTRGLIHRETAGGANNLTVLPRAKELYIMLEESSLLLEMYRDDICQPVRSGGLPARPTLALGRAPERFGAIAMLISELWKSEANLRIAFRNNGAPESGALFVGSVFECARMRSGFYRSVRAFYPVGETPGEVEEMLVQLNRLSVPVECS